MPIRSLNFKPRNPRTATRAVPTLLLFALLFPSLAWCADKPGYDVVVTIDDLPVVTPGTMSITQQRDVTTRLLKSLTTRKIPAIGFVNENKLYVDGAIDPKRVALLQQWIDSGMELGNHTFAHLDLHRIPVEEFLVQIERGETETNKLLAKRGKKIRWLRHPFLHTGRSREVRNTVDSFLAKRNVRVAPVTMDNSEWIYARAYDVAAQRKNTGLQQKVAAEYVDYMMRKDAYYRTQAKRLFGREIAHILLIHANALNARAFGELADRMKASGARFVTLEAAMKDAAYQSRDDYFGPAGLSWLDRWALTSGKKGDFFAAEPRTPQHILDLAGIDSE